MGFAHCGYPGLEGIEGAGRCRVVRVYWAVSRYHATNPTDPIIDVKSEIDGVLELDGRDLAVDEEQGMSRFAVLAKNNAEHYWYPDQSSALVGDSVQNFKRHAKCGTGGLFGLP